MNEEDLRDCFAMFAMTGWIMNGHYSGEECAAKAYEVADMMLNVRKLKDESGIAAIKPRVRKRA